MPNTTKTPRGKTASDAANASAASDPILSRVLRLEEAEQTPASERQGAAFTRVLHDLGLGSGPYARMLRGRGSGAMAATAHDFVDQFVEEMRPRNPIERMLAVQLLWQHLRIGRLVELADRCAGEPDLAKAYGAAVETAMGTFRRHAQALDALHTPRPIQFIHDSQVNVAQQQVVTNGHAPASPPEGEHHGANEQGSAPRPAALPAEPGGQGEPAACDRADAPVGARDRTEDAGGQGPRVSERPKARPPRRRGPGAGARAG